jgi:hypothetical protein
MTTTGTLQPGSEIFAPRSRSSTLACAFGVGDGAAVRELGGFPHPAPHATTPIAIARIVDPVAMVPRAPVIPVIPVIPIIPIGPVGHIISIMRWFRAAIQRFA